MTPPHPNIAKTVRDLVELGLIDKTTGACTELGRTMPLDELKALLTPKKPSKRVPRNTP